MNETEMLTVLSALEYEERQAVRAVELAEPQFVDGEIAAKLREFRDDHARHVRALEGLIAGRRTQQPSHDFMAYVQELLHLVDGAPDDDAATRALLLLERSVTADYAELDGADLPGDVTDILRRHLAEEQAHVTYVEARTPVASGISSGPRGTYPYHGVEGGTAPGVAPGSGGSIGGAVSGAAPRAHGFRKGGEDEREPER